MYIATISTFRQVRTVRRSVSFSNHQPSSVCCLPACLCFGCSWPCAVWQAAFWSMPLCPSTTAHCVASGRRAFRRAKREGKYFFWGPEASSHQRLLDRSPRHGSVRLEPAGTLIFIGIPRAALYVCSHRYICTTQFSTLAISGKGLLSLTCFFSCFR